MKIIKVLLILFILLCTVSLVDAKTNSNENYRLEYLNLDWWQKYNDQVLIDYISAAFKNNQDLKIPDGSNHPAISFPENDDPYSP